MTTPLLLLALISLVAGAISGWQYWPIYSLSIAAIFSGLAGAGLFAGFAQLLQVSQQTNEHLAALRRELKAAGGDMKS